MATATDLNEYLADNPPKGFNALANYFADGDHVSYFISNERCFEERIDDLVTAYTSMTTKRLVGIKVKGVKRILDSLGGKEFIVMVTKRPVTVSLLLVGAGLIEPGSRDKYAQLGRKSILEVPINALSSAA